MIYVIALLLGLLLIFGPQLWVKWVLQRYNRRPEENFPGTGGELARHLLDRYELQEVKVEITELGDHYDPSARTVRLTRDKFEGKTLTAITVAAHECGHAFQHAASEPLFLLRNRLAVAGLLIIVGFGGSGCNLDLPTLPAWLGIPAVRNDCGSPSQSP